MPQAAGKTPDNCHWLWTIFDHFRKWFLELRHGKNDHRVFNCVPFWLCQVNWEIDFLNAWNSECTFASTQSLRWFLRWLWPLRGLFRKRRWPRWRARDSQGRGHCDGPLGHPGGALRGELRWADSQQAGGQTGCGQTEVQLQAGNGH